MTILAIDPGKHSGWAMLRDGFFLAGEEDYLEVVDLAYKHHPVHLIVEKFIIPPRAFNSPWSLEVIGALKQYKRMYAVNFHEQLASDAKHFVDNNRLKRLGWYTRGSDHARDATRHLVLWLAKNDPALLPKEIPMCHCSPRDRIRSGDDPDKCYRCAQPIPEAK